MKRWLTAIFFCWGAGFLVACQTEILETPTLAVSVPTLVGTATSTHGDVPATWTPLPLAARQTQEARPTFTPRASRTPLVLPTATPTAVPTSTPTATASPTLTPTATALPTTSAANLLPNPSFEAGWYHPGGVPELQIPERWTFEYVVGENRLDPDPWNEWVRPEVRVLPSKMLPASEHTLFIWSGDQTVKVFKGQGAINFRLVTDVTLPPGRYVLLVRVFPDLVVGYTEAGEKEWAPDPLSGEVRLVVGDRATPWQLPLFGRRNTYSHTFVVPETSTMSVGAAIRGRWAIENNGWFLDDWALYRIDDTG